MNKSINKNLLLQCGAFLKHKKLKLCCAESMTAGFLSSTWALEKHSGSYFLGAIICYDRIIKTELLNVSDKLIDRYTPVSSEVTLAMLSGLKYLLSFSDVYISVTGLAYASNNSNQDRPIGTIYYAFSYREHEKLFQKYIPKGTASEIIAQACNNIYEDLYHWLKQIID